MIAEKQETYVTHRVYIQSDNESNSRFSQALRSAVVISEPPIFFFIAITLSRDSRYFSMLRSTLQAQMFSLKYDYRCRLRVESKSCATPLVRLNAQDAIAALCCGNNIRPRRDMTSGIARADIIVLL